MEELENLKKIYEKGYMSKVEYEARRTQIIDKITNTSLTPIAFGPSTLAPVTSALPPNNLPLDAQEDKGDKEVVFEPGEYLPVSQTSDELFLPPPALNMQQKYELANQISKLDPQCLDYIIQMINSRIPTLLRFNDEANEYSFDLSEFDDNTLSVLNEYVQQFTANNIPAPTRRGQKRREPERRALATSAEIVEEADIRPPFDDEPFSEPKRPKIEPSYKDETPPITGESKKIRIKVKIYRVEKSAPGPKPWKCDAEGCDKTFGDSSNLIKHIRTHTGEKPYVCSECSKSFAHSSTLKEHLLSHSGQKPFACTVEGCDASFAQKSNLTRHLRTHTGDKPYVCQDCGKAFSQSSNLKQHRGTQHNGMKT